MPKLGVSEDESLYYSDAITGEMRRRRGKRKKPRGPYSTAEKAMVLSWKLLMARMHYMDGELADLAARYFTSVFTLWDQSVSRYSYENLNDPQPADWERLQEELGVAITKNESPDMSKDFDVGNLKLLLASRSRACAMRRKNKQFRIRFRDRDFLLLEFF